MLFYFSDEKVAESAKTRRMAVVDAYKDLSRHDDAFARALASTTKTQPATIYRIQAWGRALAEIIQERIEVPVLTDGTKEVRFETA
jgi:hypothetical protein